jgi:hypothetical protein
MMTLFWLISFDIINKLCCDCEASDNDVLYTYNNYCGTQLNMDSQTHYLEPV